MKKKKARASRVRLAPCGLSSRFAPEMSAGDVPSKGKRALWS